MQTIGIDMSKDTFHAAFEDSSVKVFCNTDEGIYSFINVLSEKGAQSERTVLGVEATGIYHLLLCDRLTQRGWNINVINPILTARMASGKVRTVKTDTADARSIRSAVLAGLGYPYTESREILALKALQTQRQALVKIRAKLKQIKANQAFR